MGHINHGLVHAALQLLDLHPHLITQLGVQVAERLIQKIDRGLLHDGPAHGHPLALAPGKLSIPMEALLKRHQPGVPMQLPTQCDLGHPIPAVREALLQVLARGMDFRAQMVARVLATHPGTILTIDIPARAASPAHQRILDHAEMRKQ